MSADLICEPAPAVAAGLGQFAEALSRIAPLSRDDVRAIEDLPADVRFVEKGGRLIDPQMTCDTCHLLINAFAHKRKFIGTTNRVVAINLPGEVVNVESALQLNSDYAAEVFRAGEAAIIPAAALREAIFSHPGIARALWTWSHREAAIYRQWLVNDEQRSLQSRIAHLLCETAGRLQPQDGSALFIPLSPSEIARALGSVAPYVGNELARFRSDGIVEIDSDGLAVLDLRRLRAIAEYDGSYLLKAPRA